MRGKRAGAGGRDAPRIGEGTRASEFQSDRRRLRGSRTRTSIIEAMIDLIEAGNSQPNSLQVAEHAGVSRRTVFHHFRDLDALFVSAAEVHGARHRSLITTIPPRGPVEVRIRATCRQRRELFETIAAVHGAAHARTQALPDLASYLADHRFTLRRHLAITLAPELDARGARAEVLLDAVELATGWETWHGLRSQGQHSATSAEEITLYAVTHLLH